MPKLLDFLKDKNISHEEVMEYFADKVGKPDLKTREELAEELKKSKAKIKKETKEKKEEDEEEEEEQIEKTDVEKLTDSMSKMAKEITELKKTAIKRKRPKPSTKVLEADLPDSVTVRIQKNMFETDI